MGNRRAQPGHRHGGFWRAGTLPRFGGAGGEQKHNAGQPAGRQAGAAPFHPNRGGHQGSPLRDGRRGGDRSAPADSKRGFRPDQIDGGGSGRSGILFAKE